MSVEWAYGRNRLASSRPFREQLLDTPPERVPAGLAAAVGRICQPLHEIRSAYLCAVLITPFDAEPYEALNLGILLTEPPREAAEFQERSDILELLRSFYEEAPEEMRPSMWTFLTEDALHAWRRRAHCVFERS